MAGALEAEGSALVFVSVEKFNHGVSSEVKKRKWAEITDQVNALGENHREVLTTHSVPSHPGLVVLKVIGGGATRGRGYHGGRGSSRLTCSSYNNSKNSHCFYLMCD